jgi:hypothetical protein
MAEQVNGRIIDCELRTTNLQRANLPVIKACFQKKLFCRKMIYYAITPKNFVNLTKFQVVFFIRENPFDPLNPRSILVAAWRF